MIDTLIAAVVLDTDRAPSPSRAAVSRITSAATIVPRGWAAFARCVEQRESHGNPKALNSSGAAGLFQFMPDWRHGLPYMVADRLKRNGLGSRYASTIRLTLARTPINHWPADMQRIGFAEVLDRGGWQHWHLAGSSCERLVP